MDDKLPTTLVIASAFVVCGVYLYRRQQAHNVKTQPPKRVKIEIGPNNSHEFFQFPPIHELSYRDVRGHLATYSILDKDDPDKQWVLEHLDKGTDLDPQTDRAIAVLMGNVIGDALGAPFEFSRVTYGSTEMQNGFEDVAIWKKKGYNSFRLKPGQWTDDASMGLCLADSLLVKNTFDPQDLRLRFVNWWKLGYNNAFGYDDSRSKGSVGLGGNISLSMREFLTRLNEYTKEGDKSTSGNGSVMRNGAIPIFFYSWPEQALDFAYKQSRTTHQGEEAAECCRLLTHICIKAISLGVDASPASILDDLSSFESPLYSVQCLTHSRQEEPDPSNQEFSLEDRNWNWKDVDFKYSPMRARSQPGYVGSYAMDALAMALHCVYTTTSFTEATLKCANLRGDSDSVCAVAGQIAGAIYGYSSIPEYWIKTIRQWDPEATIQTRAIKLWNHGSGQCNKH